MFSLVGTGTGTGINLGTGTGTGTGIFIIPVPVPVLVPVFSDLVPVPVRKFWYRYNAGPEATSMNDSYDGMHSGQGIGR